MLLVNVYGNALDGIGHIRILFFVKPEYELCPATSAPATDANTQPIVRRDVLRPHDLLDFLSGLFTDRYRVVERHRLGMNFIRLMYINLW